MNKASDWQRLESQLPHTFENAALLKQALTHRSHSAEHNERFEFLGDALLETIISAELFVRLPYEPEGNLTRVRASIVNRNQLAKLAKSLNIGAYLLLGSGEMKSGGARRESTLADAIEAIIAAVYLDSDFATCRGFTLALFAEVLEHLPSAESLKDAKTRLQEYLQGRGLPLPSYEVTDERGPEHAREFEVSVSSEQFTLSARGSSRKKAEQQAAENLLNHYLNRS
ncbi:ribonuclease III [Suttonella sp. R2A3]|uniref:ribonuclease III n=1 Tax=Suttonella sp. R2A3 TaxID=2908648 RepID=UPI001F41D0C3|nr:ribonuclease III [Suttonella sp. R2A3]UJF24814.1 ribonuclease III [Suttonella sp. R2A3]